MANFEKDDGDILKMVTMLERHLTRDGTFDSTSRPSIEQVEEALEEAEQEMFGWLAMAGFSTTIADYPDAAKQYLTWFVALGTAYRLELSNPGLQSNPRGNSRWQVLKSQYDKLQKALATPMLDRLGVARTYETLSVITGVSYDGKKAITTDDTDKVRSFFSRDMMRHPNRSDPAPSVTRELT